MAATVSFSAAAVLARNGKPLCRSFNTFCFRRTISNYFSSSSIRNVKPLSAIVHSSSSSSSISSLLESTQRRFCRSASSETAAGINTAAEDVTLDSTVSSPSEVEEEKEEEDPIRKSAAALDIRVGKILKAWVHPEADSLYIEEVDCGEPEPRTICSGLVKYVPLDQLQDAQVIVLANLKPRNMCGVKSNGMLLCASDASHENVELLQAPEGSIPGERIWFGAEDEKNSSEPASPNQIQKKKIWEAVKPHMKTDSNCVAAVGVHPMRTSAGLVVCKSLRDGNVS
ncbi:hypothetical protein C5167_011509 [Papaver somniferum]|uniref:tRNA-binding domain-containing protein n=1 Tax=Papaver somniferum TaxID=3469 RepID=A0A4Y7K3A1_PAPSO|nr:tyrosine--tRNA ligase, cytoplasmic-like [Papaver somniferum]RZC67814.1 hypothetical protein C5167_011509 [Papaver somniferum]